MTAKSERTKQSSDRHVQAEKTRAKLQAAFTARHNAARKKAFVAFEETGVPELFSDADIVLNELTSVRRYMLDGCPDGIPRIRPFTVSLIKRMLTSVAFVRYDAWVLDKNLTDDEILKQGDFCDDDAYLSRFCFDSGDGFLVERRSEYVAQRKILRAFSDYVRTSAAYAKEIGAVKSAEIWLRAFDIILLYAPKSTSVPYSAKEMDRIFDYVFEAASELYVAWMYPKLPSLEQLRKEPEET